MTPDARAALAETLARALFGDKWNEPQPYLLPVTVIARVLAQEEPPQIEILEELHRVFTRHGIASYTDYPGLATDVIRWAVQACRQSKSVELAQEEPPPPPDLNAQAEDIASQRENFGLDNYIDLIERALRNAYEQGYEERTDELDAADARLRQCEQERDWIRERLGLKPIDTWGAVMKRLDEQLAAHGRLWTALERIYQLGGAEHLVSRTNVDTAWDIARAALIQSPEEPTP